MEHQVQTFMICADCAGVNNIDSNNDKDTHIFAISIPRKACQTCIDTAYATYHAASKDTYTHIYLQDRVNDEYLAR